MVAQAISEFVKEHLSDTPPMPCEFKVGEVVHFTNDFGIEFQNLEVIGFAKPEDVLYGRFIHLAKDSYWFPVAPTSLSRDKAPRILKKDSKAWQLATLLSKRKGSCSKPVRLTTTGKVIMNSTIRSNQWIKSLDDFIAIAKSKGMRPEVLRKFEVA